MKTSILFVVSFTAIANAQAIPNLPPCGSGSVMLPAISASNCGFTDPVCLCKNQNFKDAAMTKIPKACPAAADVQAYSKFINDQCNGQPGYPITIGAKDAAPPAPASAAAPASPPSQSASSARDASHSPTQTSENHAALSSATAPKPASYTGSAVSLSSMGSVAVAICLAVLAF